MKLQVKLGLSTGILVGAMFLSTLSSHVRVAEANRLSDDLNSSRLPLIASTHELHAELSLSVRALESYILFGIDPASADRFLRERQERIARVDQSSLTLMEYVAKVKLSDHEEELLHKIEGETGQMKSLEQRIEELNKSHTQAGIAQAYDLLRNDLLVANTNLDRELIDLATSQNNISDQENIDLRQANRSVIMTLWITTLLSAIFGGFISYLITRRIARDICSLAEHANGIAAGDLTGNQVAIDSKDQVGDLAEAMRAMQTSLASVIGAVLNTARTLTGNADSMHSASDLIHRRIDEQSQQTQQAATALQQMSASIAEVSRHAQSAADTARSAAQTAHEGGDIVKQMLASMSSIATAVSETSNTVGLLGEDSKRISKIVTVIDEIARKTNLLALNAAIEAARAGEQGRGFAVVAGEVRRLAESTAQATSQISSMIRGIQERTHIAIASMASGTVTVGQGVITTNLAGEALGRIIGMAERVDRMIAQIAIAATQQSVAANQSSASLHSIYSLSHENLSEMATTSSGIEALRSTAVTLEQHVVHFHVNDTSSTHNPLPTLLGAPAVLPKLMPA